MTTKQRFFVEAYVGPARGNATEAARLAGYAGDQATLAQVGYENLRKPEVAVVVRARVESVAMEADEVMVELTKVARLDASTPGLAGCKVRALEVLARIHGLLSEKLTIEVDRKAVLEEIRKLADRVRKGLPSGAGVVDGAPQ